MSILELFSKLKFEPYQLMIVLVLLILLVPLMIRRQFAKNTTPKTRYSSIKNLKSIKPSFKIKIRHLPFFMRLFAILLLGLAVAHPWVEKINPPEEEVKKQEKQDNNEPKKDDRRKIQVPAEGISIQLLIDRSGSMGIFTQRMQRGREIKSNYIKYENELLSKLDVVKVISKQFIMGNENTKKDNGFNGRWSDLIGLYTFARYPFVACPLTLRHDLLLNYISQLEVAKNQDEDGTYIGYALERVVLQVIDAREKAKKEDSYHIKSSIIILITDGEQVIFPEDSTDRHKALLPTEVAKIAKENNIKIYSIVIKPRAFYYEDGTVMEQPGMYREFSVEEVKNCAELTGGKCYIAKDGSSLLEIYKDIDMLEKSKLPSKKEIEVKVEKENKINKKEVQKVELFQPLLWLSLICFISEILLTNLYFRRVP